MSSRAKINVRFESDREPPVDRGSRGGGPYRSRKGMIFGVCRGLAEYLGVSVFWFRVAVVAVCIFTGVGLPAVCIAYLLAALLMKLEPVMPFETDADAEFYNSYTASRPMAIHRLKRIFDSLDRRIQRLEHIVTAKDYEWEQRLDERN